MGDLAEFLKSQAWTVHLSYALVAIAFALPRLYWLRVVAILGFLLQALYLALTTSGLYTDIQWALIFVLINLAMLARMTMARSLELPPADRALLRRVLPGLADPQLARLVAVAERREIAAGDELTLQGAAVDRLYFLLGGAADVAIDGVEVARVSPGGFVGEMSFLTGNPASATVRMAFAGAALVFRRAELERLFSRDEEMRAAFQTLIGADLVDKMSRANQALRQRAG